MSLCAFQVAVHVRPPGAASGATRLLRGVELPTLDVRPADLNHGFPRTFEESTAAIERFERMFVEPDGSFVWRSPAGEAPWQLDGMIYDRAGRVLYVELKGTCPAERLEQFLAAFGVEPREIVFQLSREAVFIDLDAFRRYAAGDA